MCDIRVEPPLGMPWELEDIRVARMYLGKAKTRLQKSGLLSDRAEKRLEALDAELGTILEELS